MRHTSGMLITGESKARDMPEQQRALGADGVLTLKHLALLGALDSQEKISCSGLGERLDASTQTASRRLQRLEEGGYLDRDVVGDGQWVEVTERGAQRLQAEYADYRQVFERDTGVTLSGTVTSGMGEGRHYITLEGYMRQFVEKLGYEPFAGTLNIDLTPDSVRKRARLSSFEPVTIEGWESEDRSYGPASCYPTTLEGVQTVNVRPRVQGFIVEMRVDEGDPVEQGQVLFRLNNEEYRAPLSNSNVELIETGQTGESELIIRVKGGTEVDAGTPITEMGAFFNGEGGGGSWWNSRCGSGTFLQYGGCDGFDHVGEIL